MECVEGWGRAFPFQIVAEHADSQERSSGERDLRFFVRTTIGSPRGRRRRDQLSVLRLALRSARSQPGSVAAREKEPDSERSGYGEGIQPLGGFLTRSFVEAKPVDRWHRSHQTPKGLSQ